MIFEMPSRRGQQPETQIAEAFHLISNWQVLQGGNENGRPENLLNAPDSAERAEFTAKIGSLGNSCHERMVVDLQSRNFPKSPRKQIIVGAFEISVLWPIKKSSWTLSLAADPIGMKSP